MEYSFDEKYLQALTDRDPYVQNHLISLFDCKVRMRLRTRLRSPEMVDDATQETFFRILTYFHAGKTLRVPGALPNFINTVCTHISLEMLRSGAHYDQIPEASPNPVDFRADPEYSVLAKEQKQIVRQALRHLPEKDKRLLQRVFLEEADKNQVCREFKTNRDNLRVLLHRAKLRFKAVLQRSHQRNEEQLP